MSHSNSTAHLISHEEVHEETDAKLLARTRSRLICAGDLPNVTVAQLLSLADELSSSDLGRFLLRNRGLNAYWTHQVVTHVPGTFTPSTAEGLDYHLFERLPATLATRERFGIFRMELKALMKPGITVASVPSGFMGDLFLLDYGHAPDISFVGVDLDPAALEGAKALAAEAGLANQLTLLQQDAWALELDGNVDVLVSNGLNIYEPDDERVVALYRLFRDSLRPGGTLITSFLTPPPTISAASPWNLQAIEPEAVALQTLLFVKIIEAKWQTFRTHTQTLEQLHRAGFADIRFIDDRARMFPAVVARRPQC